ncbi:GHKL domain-containing protein [Lachnospiraceae bacterium 54-11]
MVDRICVVLEALSIAVCLHRLYGKKFRFDIATVSLMTIEMIMMQAIDYFGWPSILSALFAPVILVYCLFEFGCDLKALIINNVLNSIIICVLQIIVMMIFYMFDNQQFVVGIGPVVSNGIILSIVLFLFPRIKIDYFASLLKEKENTLTFSLLICIAIIVYCLFNFKRINFLNHLEWFQNILFSICTVMICFLALRLSKYRIKSKEIETELKMHRLYADSFDNLIANIRSRQHEFDNHINTIYSQHYIYKTYEELVGAQKNYCHILTTENKFNKLLTSGNRVIIGFLYGKFVEVEKNGIDISYHICIGELQVGVPIYKFVEILGNLIDNAIEALKNEKEGKSLYILMEERNYEFYLEVRNESEYINYSEIQLFFAKGYSKKGENRGLGLFHVKTICDEYRLELLTQNKEIDGRNWISFAITNKKETT